MMGRESYKVITDHHGCMLKKVSIIFVTFSFGADEFPTKAKVKPCMPSIRSMKFFQGNGIWHSGIMIAEAYLVGKHLKKNCICNTCKQQIWIVAV